jgi:glycosyltransferase involved in cell wall biosynthesis
MSESFTDQGKIAIVLPVFNVESYLSECLQSILAQTYRNFVLIAVDDGSTDASGRLLEEAARLDSRIKVLHKPNGGVSSARNRALDEIINFKDIAFLCFIDADDRISSQYLLLFVQALSQEKADYAVCSYQCFNRLGVSSVSGSVPTSQILDQEGIVSQFFCISLKTCFAVKANSTTSLFLNNRFFRYEAIKGLRFNESLKACEDQDFLIRAIPNLKKGVVVPQTLFFYRRRISSLSNQASVKGYDLQVYEDFYARRNTFGRAIRMGIQAEYLAKLTQNLFTILASGTDLITQRKAYTHCLEVLRGSFDFPFEPSMKRKALLIKSGFFFTKIWAQGRNFSKRLRNRYRDWRFFP